jgi:hypothetical protein
LEQHSDIAISSEPEKLFQWMKERALDKELGHFPGDRDLFYKLYHTGKDMDLLEYAMLTIQQDRVTGGIIVHPGIVERFIDHCERHGCNNILFAEAEKYIKGLIETKCYHRPWTITLLTENYIIGRLFKTYFEPYSNIRIVQGSIYQPLPMENQFDAILAMPNFGMKMNDDDITVRESEGAAASYLLPLLQEGGIGADFRHRGADPHVPQDDQRAGPCADGERGTARFRHRDVSGYRPSGLRSDSAWASRRNSKASLTCTKSPILCRSTPSSSLIFSIRYSTVLR